MTAPERDKLALDVGRHVLELLEARGCTVRDFRDAREVVRAMVRTAFDIVDHMEQYRKEG